ncbi:antibiotic biosynthesis monooxygenase [Flavobacterium sp. F372]|uniref:Antibiotic biosynthesis monooxygenase n=1 Tax=Flavobacterium bernardetii TaxID=2813823 RepID=A0ABR7IUW8_9FLAO|nr:antibiotic biosynthesis monooxygenase [Flavobacterium bernardetii]MBC5833557.1 antibiotic biosynthesis monooxygenase [Flavobacterium bernardetii]NHF68789.1 antibiotic biosynthesis monooxygenase [Flavobacterium bernardetii]
MQTPYYAVIFTSKRTELDDNYAEMALKMETLAKLQSGFLGVESARNEIGITVSYWESLEAIANWKQNLDHLDAQFLGRQRWYENYVVRIAKVEKEYGFEK